MQHLLFPVGNYLFPVVIILQHAADPVSNTSHSTCHQQAIPGSLQCPLYPQPPLPGAGVKGTDKWLEVEGEGEMRNVGWVKWKMDAPSINTHPAHMHTYICLSLVKGESARKDLWSVNDRYLSCSDAFCADSLVRGCRERREGASSLSSIIRVVD